jgi:hypothetical protein
MLLTLIGPWKSDSRITKTGTTIVINEDPLLKKELLKS